jgi:hypothetical protein
MYLMSRGINSGENTMMIPPVDDFSADPELAALKTQIETMLASRVDAARAATQTVGGESEAERRLARFASVLAAPVRQARAECHDARDRRTPAWAKAGV